MPGVFRLDPDAATGFAAITDVRAAQAFAVIRSASGEPFDRLARELRDELEVLVQVEDGELGQLSSGCDQQVWDRSCSMMATLCQCQLYLDGAVFDGRREVLHRHACQGWPIASGS